MTSAPGPGADVSIVIVSYNTRQLTLRCLGALAPAGAADVRSELIVVDNDSHDGSADAISTSFPGVRLIRLAENVGWGRAVNRAAAISEAPYLLLLNPDAEPVGDAIAELVRFARLNPGHGLYAGRTLRADGSDDGHSCLGLPSLWSCFAFATGLSTALGRAAWANPELLPDYDRRSARVVPVVTGCFMLVARDMFLDLGGFDPRYFMYSEDIDLSARAAAAGARPLVCPDASVVHIGGASSSSEGQRVKLLRGKATYFDIHWSPARARWGVRFLTAGVALRAVATAILARTRQRGSASVDWVEVWHQRQLWQAGWPETEENRPSREPGGQLVGR